MNLLCDTHICLWFATGDSKLRSDQRKALEGGENIVFLSAVSVTEISIKYSTGKLLLPEDPKTYIPRLRGRIHFAELPLGEEAALHLASLPLLHRDPFDRLLICQALAHGLTLVTSDPLILQYNIPIL